MLLSELVIPEGASVATILLLGALLGLRHAVEADHLAAVSAIVSERKNVFSASLVGGMWGVGHTISLLLVGAVVIYLKLQISERVESILEACVGVMLVLLGLNALRKLWSAKDSLHIHEHSHDGHAHLHVHSHEKSDSPKWHHNLSPRSVLIGMVHGMAGSAALMLLVVPVIESPTLALGYILIFGVGSIGGMMLMSFLIGLPFHFTASRFSALNKGIRLLAGAFSLILGAFIIYENLST